MIIHLKIVLDVIAFIGCVGIAYVIGLLLRFGSDLTKKSETIALLICVAIVSFAFMCCSGLIKLIW